ncbi:MAG: DUF998 domain-containing protein [Thermomicrobiales bacterium]
MTLVRDGTATELVRSRWRPLATGAGVLWIVAGVAYLSLEAIAAAGYRGGYSYARNYISDLGVTRASMFEGRMIDSPRAVVMNTGFYLEGMLFLAAAVLAVRAFAGRRGWLFGGLAATHTIGNIVVGTIHGGGTEAASGSIQWHTIGAALAIVGGNATVLAGAGLSRQIGSPRWYRAVSVTLGVLGMSCLVMLLVDRGSTTVNLLPEGTWERGSVYTVTAWELVTGACLLTFTRRRERPAVLPA